MTEFDDLSKQVQEQVLERAGEWLRTHEEQVDSLPVSDDLAFPPVAGDLYRPERWKAAHWRWFKTREVRPSAPVASQQGSPPSPVDDEQVVDWQANPVFRAIERAGHEADTQFVEAAVIALSVLLATFGTDLIKGYVPGPITFMATLVVGYFVLRAGSVLLYVWWHRRRANHALQTALENAESLNAFREMLSLLFAVFRAPTINAQAGLNLAARGRMPPSEYELTEVFGPAARYLRKTTVDMRLDLERARQGVQKKKQGA